MLGNKKTPNVPAGTGTGKTAQGAENPYIGNKVESDDRNTNLAVSRHNWMRAWQMQTALLAVSIALNGYYMTQNKFIPYVVEVDKIGHVIAVGVADKANPIDTKRIVRASIEEWVSNSRRIIGDKLEQKRLVNKVYARVSSNGRAKNMLDEYYKDRDIWATAAQYSIAAEVKLLLPGAGNTYQVEWDETWRDLSGAVVRVERWKANLTFDVIPLNSDEAIRANPEGLFITDFSWSKHI